MATYMMFGKYSLDSLQHISQKRTDIAVGLVEEVGGQIMAIYALLGEYDLVLVVNLPGNQEALELSIAVSRATGISFTTAPAVSVERYDSLIQQDIEDLEPNEK